MLKEKLTIGVRTPFEFSVEVIYNAAETLEEIQREHKATEQYIVDRYTRADRIMFQEQSDARNVLRDMLQAIVKADSKIKSEQQLSEAQRSAIRAAVLKQIADFKRDAQRRKRSASSNIVTLTRAEYDSMSEVVRKALLAQNVTFNIVEAQSSNVAQSASEARNVSRRAAARA